MCKTLVMPLLELADAPARMTQTSADVLVVHPACQFPAALTHITHISGRNASRTEIWKRRFAQQGQPRTMEISIRIVDLRWIDYERLLPSNGDSTNPLTKMTR